MQNIPPELVTLLVQGGFAALFTWLLIDTRNESRQRETRANEREGKLQVMLEAYAAQLPRISDSLGRIEKRLEDFERERGR